LIIHRAGVLVGSSTSSDERREKQTLPGDARNVHFGAKGLHPVQGLCTNPRRSRASCLNENSVPDTSFWMQETRLWPPSVRKTTDRARFLYTYMHLFCSANGTKMGSGDRFAPRGARLCMALVRENGPQRVRIDTLHRPVQARCKQIQGLPGNWSKIYCAVPVTTKERGGPRMPCDVVFNS